MLILRQNFYGWEDCFVIKEKSIEAVIIPDLGGRIISLSFEGRELLRQDYKALGRKNLLSIDWGNWGGGFDWVAPQSSWNEVGWPPPDAFDSGKWMSKVENNCLLLISPISPFGVQIEKKISLLSNKMHISRRLINRGKKSVSLGLWSIFQIKNSNTVCVPLSNKPKIKWLDNRIQSSIESLYKDKIIEIDESSGERVLHFFSNKGNFKVGIYEPLSKIICCDGQVSIEIKGSFEDAAIFPHFGNIEIYRDSNLGYTEIEHLWDSSPLEIGQKKISEQVLYFEAAC